MRAKWRCVFPGRKLTAATVTRLVHSYEAIPPEGARASRTPTRGPAYRPSNPLLLWLVVTIANRQVPGQIQHHQPELRPVTFRIDSNNVLVQLRAGLQLQLARLVIVDID